MSNAGWLSALGLLGETPKRVGMAARAAFLQALGARVRARRLALAWSQTTLARECGCSYQVINGLERGRQSVYAERLAVLATALGVSADYLLGLTQTE
jgi:ribosome-binding protein aMBF1 (putative translation factor)